MVLFVVELVGEVHEFLAELYVLLGEQLDLFVEQLVYFLVFGQFFGSAGCFVLGLQLDLGELEFYGFDLRVDEVVLGESCFALLFQACYSGL